MLLLSAAVESLGVDSKLEVPLADLASRGGEYPEAVFTSSTAPATKFAAITRLIRGDWNWREMALNPSSVHELKESPDQSARFIKSDGILCTCICELRPSTFENELLGCFTDAETTWTYVCWPSMAYCSQMLKSLSRPWLRSRSGDADHGCNCSNTVQESDGASRTFLSFE